MRILAVDDLHHSFEDRLVLEGCVVDYRLDINSKEELINQLKNYDVLVVDLNFLLTKKLLIHCLRAL